MTQRQRGSHLKQRIDRLLVARGLAESRERAQRLIMSGEVRVGGHVVDKPGALVVADADVVVTGSGLPFASRGGLKLEGALRHWAIGVEGCIALDVGASTGGFTDCLLQHGAAQIIAVDVGYGQLDWRLRNDPRVVVIERANIRYLTAEQLPAVPTLAVIDVSFISLRLVLPRVAELVAPGATIVALVKPQFEVGKGKVGKGGVVRDPALHREAVEQVVECARACGLDVRGSVESPIQGPKGNREFFVYLVGSLVR